MEHDEAVALFENYLWREYPEHNSNSYFGRFLKVDDIAVEDRLCEGNICFFVFTVTVTVTRAYDTSSDEDRFFLDFFGAPLGAGGDVEETKTGETEWSFRKYEKSWRSE